MKAGINLQLRLPKLWGSVYFTPDVLVPAGQNGLAPGMIAVQHLRNFQNAFQVFPKRLMVAVALGLAQSIAHQIFRQDRLISMRFVLWPPRLEIKADGATFR